MNTSSYTIAISGLNLHHIINHFQANKIYMSYIYRESNKKLVCTITKNDYLKLKKSPIFKKYKIKIQKRYGLENIFRQFINKIGLITATIIMLLTTFNLTNNIHQITLNTTNHTCQNQENCIFTEANKQKLYSSLSLLGIKHGGKIKNIQTNKKIKQILMLEFPQISDVTIKQKGVHVYVNILEAKLPVTLSNKNLIAQENGIVIKTDVTSGKLKVKLGDIVLKGQTLIEKTDNPVCGTVVLRTFYQENLIFNQEQIKYERTGKKVCFNDIQFLSLNFNSKIKNTFPLFEKSIEKSYLSVNNLLPIIITKTTLFELKKIEQFIPFESVQDQLKNSLKEQAVNKIPSNAQIKNTTFTTKQEGSRVLLTCYIETYLTHKM